MCCSSISVLLFWWHQDSTFWKVNGSTVHVQLRGVRGWFGKQTYYILLLVAAKHVYSIRMNYTHCVVHMEVLTFWTWNIKVQTNPRAIHNCGFSPLLGQSQHQRSCKLPGQAHYGHREWHPEKRGTGHHLTSARLQKTNELLWLLQIMKQRNDGRTEQNGDTVGQRGTGARHGLPKPYWCYGLASSAPNQS